MNYQHQIGTKQVLVAAGMGLFSLPLILYGRLEFLRPPRTDTEQTLFQGIVYKRDARLTPRPLMVHIVTIDLTAPGMNVLVTPGKATPENDKDIDARTTSEFVREFKVQLAINGSYFYPFHERTPWDYFPQRGDRVTITGQAMSDGSTYSQPAPDWSVVCFNAKHRAQIMSNGECPKGTVNAIAGKDMLIDRGKPVEVRSPDSNTNRPYSRVAVGVDREGKKLWLVVIDGKQPFYSEGVTMAELREIVSKLGAYSALSMDGGGSTTLVAATSNEPTVLNAPMHTKVPMRERSVANHLGFYALPTLKKD